MTEYIERVKDYWSIGKSKYIAKLAQDGVEEGHNDKKNVMPLHLAALVLSNSERILNIFMKAIGAFKTNAVYYGDTDSLFF